ncbi:hypothetical protein EZS27_038523 [termite gut metagenome]|uniref:Uncharacterized protein n=1 Tax=termite gut metagenome TaxID=433724 RepID=A0A5J4PLK9_9ZZZZ
MIGRIIDSIIISKYGIFAYLKMRGHKDIINTSFYGITESGIKCSGRTIRRRDGRLLRVEEK